MLEGLNALLDHRAEVFIPELGRAFACPPGFRIFAAQNPVAEGGGRRGLPKSFLNRFTRVHVEPLRPADLRFISGAHPGLFRLAIRWGGRSCTATTCCKAGPSPCFGHVKRRPHTQPM